jgi:hypothetical protein
LPGSGPPTVDSSKLFNTLSNLPASRTRGFLVNFWAEKGTK